MKYSIIALALAAASLSSTAFGGFFIQETKILGTEQGAMGKHQPYEAPAEGSFRSPTANAEATQERYKNAELIVDLAYTAMTQRGSGEAGLVDGYGDDLPFNTAMSMVMPTGWHLYRDKSLEAKAVPEKISFAGGKTWPEVMKQVGDRYALHFHIDWYDRTVMMSKGRPGYAMQAGRVKVIPEPTPTIAKAVTSVATVSAAPAAKPVGGVMVMAAQTKPVSVIAGGSESSPINSSGGVKPATAISAVAVKPAAPPTPYVQPIPSWNVGVKDKTIREALKSWASLSGWTFEPEHWAVPVDIPISAGATFRGDFKTAVRQLIATTELGATPLQPCFYSNRVVRVVPFNEMCDRMSAR